MRQIIAILAIVLISSTAIAEIRCGNEFIGKGTSIDTVINNCTVTSSYAAGTVAAWGENGGVQCEKFVVNIVEEGFYGAKTPYRIVFHCGRVTSISRSD